jgi:lipoate-protein ligase A
MYKVLLVREEQKREKVISSVFQKVTTIKEEIKKSIKINQIKEFLIEGYKEVFGDNFETGILTDYELEMAEKLRNTKYYTNEWNFKIK